MCNRIEKIDKNEFRCIHFTATFEFEYESRYPYLYFSGYGYWILHISFSYSHPYSKHANADMLLHLQDATITNFTFKDLFIL
jgi:hypothetical protein